MLQNALEILDYVYIHKEITNYVVMNISVGLDGHFVKTENLINDDQAEKCIEILNDTNSQIETSKNGYSTELSEVIETIENQIVYDVKLQQ